MNFRQTVLEEGMNIFQQHGIQRLTMEAILEQLDISKGTLRGIATSKAQLLEQCVEASIALRRTESEAIIEAANGPIEAILFLLRANLRAYSGHHAEFLPDLRNHHPVCWEKMQAFTSEYLQLYLTALFNESKEQELVKPEINAKLVSKLLVTQTLTVAEAGLIVPEEQNFNLVYKLAFEYYLRGILTTKGLKALEEAVQNQSGTEVMNLN